MISFGKNVFIGAERVGHTEDLKYFWSTESNSDLSKFPEEDRLMLHQYSEIWTNFIKYGYVLFLFRQFYA